MKTKRRSTSDAGWAQRSTYMFDTSHPAASPHARASSSTTGSSPEMMVLMVAAESPTLVSVDLATGAAGSVELPESGRLMQLPGAGRVVVDHLDPLGSVTVLPDGDLGDLGDADVETHTGLFLSEVLDR